MLITVANIDGKHVLIAGDAPEDFLRDLAEDVLPHMKVLDYVLAGKTKALGA